MTTLTYNSGSGTFTVPSGVTSVTITVIGGGGGGGQGGNGGSDQGAAGGGGGGYLTKTISVSSGQAINWSVGAGGAGNTDPGIGCAVGGSGGQSEVVHVAISYRANGGTGGYSCGSGSVGAGGTTTTGNGETYTNGSAGSANSSNIGGNGGTSGSGAAGGAGGNDANGAAGTAPGGGGGGGAAGTFYGGNGGAGRITIDYIEVSAFSYTSTGGLVLSGSASTSIPPNINMTGGVSAGGASRIYLNPKDPTCLIVDCGCKQMSIDGSGGMSAGGSAVIAYTPKYRGGVIAGGSAIVRQSSIPIYGFNFLIPLSDRSDSPVDLAQDLVTAAVNTTYVPGIFCLPARKFSSDNQSTVMIEADTIKADKPFSISFWCLIDKNRTQRNLFTRGYNSTDGQWSLAISYGVIGQLVVLAQDSAGEIYEFHSSTLLHAVNWSHVGVTYSDRTFSYYINGVLEGSFTINASLPVSNGNSIGAFENESNPNATLQEFRMYNRAVDAEYFIAEKRNFCDFANFVEFGDVESPY